MSILLRATIITMAKIYSYKKDCTYEYLALRFNISKSTVWRYFNIYLPKISEKLYYKVKEKAEMNIERSHHNFEKKVA